ncbi:unnamed protein product [Adineta ricciae]|uniref:Attractin/MKLN-like beta-propeller domain-containing protein n=1 Tax=Adineta ricciae TaxID=249248 RepID=A0A815DSA7_ADIRI|nr:unnamed protein product [Adineta ricciae]
MFLFKSLFLILIYVPSILSCSCISLSIDAEFYQSTIIFIGRIISSSIKDFNSVMGYAQMTMEVEESIKGIKVGDFITIQSYLEGSMCGMGSLSNGSRWQIWLTTDNFINLCSRNTQNVNKDIDILRNFALEERLNIVKENNVTKETDIRKNTEVDSKLNDWYEYEIEDEIPSQDIREEYFLTLYLVLFALIQITSTTTNQSKWSNTSPLHYGRSMHATSLLKNGNVLVTGGTSGDFLHSTELYHPSTGNWTKTGLMNNGRYQHASVTLKNGKVLVMGGMDDHIGISGTSELYNPLTRNWTFTGNLRNPRYMHTASLLPNGKVLIVGGWGLDDIHSSAELYDPLTGNWTLTGSMNISRYQHTASVLSNGKVLVNGGFTNGEGFLRSSELYDPLTGTWKIVSSMPYPTRLHATVSLKNGKLLVTGGFNEDRDAVKNATVFDPSTETWTPTKSMQNIRGMHTASLLPNGNVLVAGGCLTSIYSSGIKTAELYNPIAKKWTNTCSMHDNRWSNTATVLHNGDVLVVGNSNIAELYNSST